ncbi:MAG: Mur ligase family protein [Minisyncoccia bacterium]
MINIIFVFLTFFWLFSTIKNLLFHLYLWQLKEYHLKRYLAHFSTFQGKRIFKNFLFISKIFLLLILTLLLKFNFFSSNLLVLIIFLIWVLFFLEGLKNLILFEKNRILKPIFTKKIVFLLFVFNLILLLFIFDQFKYLFLSENFELFTLNLLCFDISFPFLISLFIIFFQFFVNLKIKLTLLKAENKLKRLKNILIIGITGSFGKTSTKEFLYKVLADKFGEKVIKTKEHINAEIGIANTILKEINDSHKIFIAEIGAYEKGKIKQVCKMLKPKIGILTGICEQHLATFGSLENIKKGKFELIESLPENGISILNADNNYVLEGLEEFKDKIKVKKKIFCSKNKELDIFAKNIFVGKNSLLFEVISRQDGDRALFKLNLIGIDYIQNILLVAATAKELGLYLQQISKSCEKITEKDAGIYLEKFNENTDIIFSNYSANPVGVFSHLEHLKLWQGKKIVIMPCLIELGRKAKSIHQKIGKKIAECCDIGIIQNKDYIEDIIKGAKEINKGEKILLLEEKNSILNFILKFIEKEKDNVILLEGRLSQNIINAFKKS